jgi:hypothetical protein
MQLAMQTVKGTAELLQQSGMHPGALKGSGYKSRWHYYCRNYPFGDSWPEGSIDRGCKSRSATFPGIRPVNLPEFVLPKGILKILESPR